MGRLCALSALLDAILIAAAVDLSVLALLVALFLVAPETNFVGVGLVGFIISLGAFLCRDSRGGLSRRWLGFGIEDDRGRPPGWGRSAIRNLPLLVPGWNLYEAYRVWRRPDEPRPVDRILKLRFKEVD